MKMVRAVALVAAALSFVTLAYVIAHRIAYPFDLEWLEGATLWHAQRIADGLPLYPAPTIDFVPHPYPPLYPALLALFAHLGGGGSVSYALGRGVSTAAFAGALVVGGRFVRRAGGSRALAVAAMAIPCAAYVCVGSWYDLVRVDSLWLLLTAAGTTLAWEATPARAAGSALLLVAAFFTKQTAAPFMVAVAIGLAVMNRRAAIVYVATLAVVGLPALALVQRATGGWFWFYISRVHRSHAFTGAAALHAPGRIATFLLPAIPLVGLALVRRRSRALGWATLLAATSVAVSAIARATAGAYINAHIPAIYFSSLLAGVAAAELGETAVAWALVAATIVLAPRVVPGVLQALAPRLYLEPQTTGYAIGALLPSAESRAKEAALIARLGAVDGEVWLPTRPWYAQLAGKRPLAGEMAAMDLGPTGVPIAGFDEALRTRRFAAVVLDDPYEPLLEPVVARSTAAPLDGARVVIGTRRPSLWLTPR
jgi:hypothetical protein